MSTSNTLSSPTSRNVWLSYYTKFVCAYILFVIFAGAMVTSHDAGLSVPDWPQTYGQNMFAFPVYKWVGGIYYEHGHRLVAFGVGSLTLILAVWSFFSEKRKWVRVLSYTALGVVIAQGVLGGLTVLYGLPDLISVSHAVLAQSFLVLMVIIAYSHTREFKKRGEVFDKGSSLWKLTASVGVLVYLQLIVGAVMRHAGAGLAIMDFPLMAGSIFPPLNSETVEFLNKIRASHSLAPITLSNVVVHIIHRLGGVVVTVGVVTMLVKLVRSQEVSSAAKKLSLLLGVLVVCQFALGAITVLSERSPVIASIHVVTGALLLALTVVCTLRIIPLSNK